MGDLPNRGRPGPAASTTRIVGLGASAGGLEPLQQFFARVPAASGLAYVVVQHMDPTHKALLAELLQRDTAMPVREATQSLRIEPDVVYVIPPNAELTVAGGLLRLADPMQPRGMRLPIDLLFASLARDQGERAIGVLLSGMGADGRLGLQAIKTQGGLTLAQQPETAQFDSMPRSAIAAGCVDIVAPPGELPGRILGVVGSASHRAQPASSAGPEPAPLAAILGLLHQHSRRDLTSYKSSTVVRRIERRMAVHGLDTMSAYEALLRQNPQEIDLLLKELLIGVTSFFRDAAVWQELKDTALPALLARRTAQGQPLRAWVAGCSTGEEAYSLAMVFKEVTESLPGHAGRGLQVFATDLNAEAIAVARRGVYPESIAKDVAPERLARFFSRRESDYLVDKSLREMVLFAQHDVILDPPFTRLDILSCRNLLIYFSAPLQQRLVPLFHYSLTPGGLLLLGGSETVGRSQAMFTPVLPKSRLYRRSDHGLGAGTLHFPVHRRPPSSKAQESNVSQASAPPSNLQALADQVLLQAFAPPAVLVNEGGDIVYISGRTGRYLEPAAGKANWNIHAMVRPGIRAQLAVALRTALHDRQRVELHGLRLDGETSDAMVDITVQGIREPKALEGMAMIVFRDVAAEPPGRKRRKGAAGVAADAALGQELLRAQEEVRALRQEMHASQEELQAANEELQSTNEELQSANEELTTSKEEAQSMNEELQTINNELQSKLDDLALAQSDMQNLLNSTDIATLFLDNDLNVRRFTDRTTRVIHLREGDIGRPLSDLATTLIYPQLCADAKETLRTLAFSEKEITTSDGRWYAVRVMPYRTLANEIQGVVITFVDITTAKELESRLRKA
jgi:two-component system CheB/CheR fusion protein